MWWSCLFFEILNLKEVYALELVNHYSFFNPTFILFFFFFFLINCISFFQKNPWDQPEDINSENEQKWCYSFSELSHYKHSAFSCSMYLKNGFWGKKRNVWKEFGGFLTGCLICHLLISPILPNPSKCRWKTWI